jgi:hypothetical protein
MQEVLRHVLAIWDWIPPAKQVAHIINYPVLPVVYFIERRVTGTFELPDSKLRLAVIFGVDGASLVLDRRHTG